MERQQWVDTAKALGIFLVFFGHFVEKIVPVGSVIAFTCFKFLYAFHMPFFFFITGFFAKPTPDMLAGVKKLFLRRMVPAITFNLMLLPIWLGLFYFGAGITQSELVGMAKENILGRPAFSLITWFLICLFVCEIYAMLFLNYLKSKKLLVPAALLSLFGGLYLCMYIWSANGFLKINRDFWYIREAVVALGFYLFGYLLFPYYKEFYQKKNTLILVSIAIISLAILSFTYNLNTPFEDFNVYMIISSHGDLVPFVMSAFAGIAFMLAVSMLIPASPAIRYIGQNTLVLLGLNGVFLQFINDAIVGVYVPADQWLPMILYSTVIVLLSLLICVPFINFFNKRIPLLIGKSK